MAFFLDYSKDPAYYKKLNIMNSKIKFHKLYFINNILKIQFKNKIYTLKLFTSI